MGGPPHSQTVAPMALQTVWPTVAPGDCEEKVHTADMKGKKAVYGPRPVQRAMLERLPPPHKLLGRAGGEGQF